MTFERDELHVLFLEDSKRDVEIVHEKLKDGFKRPVLLDSAETEDEFFHCLKSKKYDVILADHTLPHLNAQEALKLAISICPDTPFICISGTIGEDIAVELLHQGAADYILKDRIGRLSFAISRAIDRAKNAKFKIEAEVLRRKEKEYLEILDGSTEASWIYDFHTKTLAYSSEWKKRIFGENIPDEEMNNFAMKLVHPDDIDRVISERKLIIEKKSPKYCCEYRFKVKTGDYIWVYDKGKIEYDENGTPIKIYGTSSDITERKRSEKELKALSESLNAEVNALNIFLRINSRFINEADASTVYMDLLDAAVLLTGADCGNMQLIADDDETLEIVAHKGCSDEFLRRYSKISGTTTICSEAKEKRSRIIVDDVSQCTIFDEENRLFMVDEGMVCIQSTPMLSVSDKLLGMMSTHYKSPHQFNERELRVIDLLARQAADVIERVRIEEALRVSENHARKLVRELEEADENKNEFLNALSHELRNPLAAISAGLQILNITQDPNQTAKAKEIMNRQMSQLCHLVDDLLDLTRISNNRVELKKEILDLNALALSAAEDNEPLFEKKGVKLITETKGDPLYVNVDSTRIKQIVGNLLTNALKFTNRGGETLMSIYMENNESVICVKDTGIGIEPELQQRLFIPFTQADTSLDRQNGGLGLGLSIAKGIAELHGGSVSIFSEGLGKGSTLKIRLPLHQYDTIQKPLKMQKNNKKNRPLKILLIEDNQDFCDILRWALKLLGHDVITAKDGMTGVTKAEDYFPNVIFCDIGLPDIDGFEVAKRIRTNDAVKDVFLIALTGYAQQRDIERALQAGFNQHLSKPIDIETIKNLLNRIPEKLAR